MYLCSDHTDPWEEKGTEGEVQQGKGSLTFTIRLYKHNYPSDEGLYTEAQTDGGAVVSNGSRTDFRCYRCGCEDL